MDISRGVKEYAEVNLALRSGPGEVLVIPAIHVSVSKKKHKNISILLLLQFPRPRLNNTTLNVVCLCE